VRRALPLVLLCACVADVDDRPATLSYLAPRIFRPSCATASCHSTLSRAAGLDLETADLATLRAELVFRTLVYPGQPEGSPLVNFLRGEDVPLRMPPDAPLPEADIQLVERWIAEGAPE
jgi:hypothetical protein